VGVGVAVEHVGDSDCDPGDGDRVESVAAVSDKLSVAVKDAVGLSVPRLADLVPVCDRERL